MEQVQPTIGSVSRQFLKNFVKKEYRNGGSSWDLREDINWQHTLIMDAYGKRMLSPEAYSTIFKILVEIYIAENREQAEDFLEDIEPYKEVDDLTGWLNSSPSNIDYLTEALDEGGFQDGQQLLARAHKLFLKEIGLKLIDAIGNLISTRNVQVYVPSAN